MPHQGVYRRCYWNRRYKRRKTCRCVCETWQRRGPFKVCKNKCTYMPGIVCANIKIFGKRQSFIEIQDNYYWEKIKPNLCWCNSKSSQTNTNAPRPFQSAFCNPLATAVLWPLLVAEIRENRYRHNYGNGVSKLFSKIGKSPAMIKMAGRELEIAQNYKWEMNKKSIFSECFESREKSGNLRESVYFICIPQSNIRVYLLSTLTTMQLFPTSCPAPSTRTSSDIRWRFRPEVVQFNNLQANSTANHVIRVGNKISYQPHKARFNGPEFICNDRRRFWV